MLQVIDEVASPLIVTDTEIQCYHEFITKVKAQATVTVSFAEPKGENFFHIHHIFQKETFLKSILQWGNVSLTHFIISYNDHQGCISISNCNSKLQYMIKSINKHQLRITSEETVIAHKYIRN